ncbi:MAG: protoporphyrinogen/coproporphyrinogen oxidase [Terriglobales bacterium]
MIAIVGGGLAGLSAAWELQRSGVADFVLLEAGDHVGGVVHTERRDGFVLEGGPESFLARKAAATTLCRELGLEGELMAPLTTAARILHRGRLHPLPAGWRMIEPGQLRPLLRSALFSRRAKWDIVWHWRDKPQHDCGDVSVFSYLQRRYGKGAGTEIAERVAAPLLAGVFGGQAEQLSLAALRLPVVVAVRQRAAGGEQAKSAPGPAFLTLQGGMGKLIDGLEQALPAERIRKRQRVRAIHATEQNKYRLEIENSSMEADAVILAVPAWAAAEFVGGLDSGVAELLAAIPYASSVNLNLAFAAAPPLPAGSGFLVPRGEGLRLVACTFVHQKFAGRAPSGAGLVRLFYGEGEAALDDPALTELALRELRGIVPSQRPPAWVQITRRPRAMPQYVVGHVARMRALREALQQHPGLALAGNAYAGVGVPDCIASGRAAARQVVTAAVTEAR